MSIRPGPDGGDYVFIPIPYCDAECRVIMEVRSSREVPGEADVPFLNFRKYWDSHVSRFYAKYFRQAALLVERDGKLLPTGERVHVLRMNEPGQYTEVIIWLTTEHCRMISEALDRQAGLADQGLVRAN